jgi:hypothetical protein
VLSTSAVASSIATGREWADRAASALEPLRRAGGENRPVDVLAGVGHRLLDELDG